jgi:hypothetical protein
MTKEVSDAIDKFTTNCCWVVITVIIGWACYIIAYENGQVDALNGIQHYQAQTNSTSVTNWIRIK